MQLILRRQEETRKELEMLRAKTAEQEAQVARLQAQSRDTGDEVHTGVKVVGGILSIIGFIAEVAANM